MKVDLWHGTGYKGTKGKVKQRKTLDDIITSLSPLSSRFLSYFLTEPLERVVVAGNPRLDYFFEDMKEVRNIVEANIHLSSYKKVIFWMPTFRQSVASNLSEDYIHNETGLPIFGSVADIEEMSDFLKENQILMVFKLHHLQANLPVFQKKWDNIILLRDEDLHDMGLQLYQFIPLSDALISDYSSVAIDYLLLDKPIIYTLDDYAGYEKSRGFWIPNAIDYMKGYHVYNKNDLEESILEISHGIDKYAEERRKLMNEYHTYKDGRASERILKLIGISK